MPKDPMHEDKPQQRDERREKQPDRVPAPNPPGPAATKEKDQPRSYNRSSDSGGMGGGNR
ncbi:MAG: hypothetical protein K0R03_2635 [Moraxellaceae bacterium]|jgi:hypothetical protein|nr:hypothetical protein [Moraxellaceae bacterium]